MMFDLNSRAKPVLKWAGGKSGILPQLASLFPKKFERYVEPFLGGGAVFFALKPGCPSVLNDSNSELVELYEIIRDCPEKLMKCLDQLASKYSENFYYQLRAQVDRDPMKKATRLVFLNKTGFNGLYRQNSKGQFNVPFGKRHKCPALYHRENLLDVSERLKKAKVKNADFEEIIDSAFAGDFVYCDPPYEPLSTTSSFNAYLASGFSTTEQKRLRDACARAANRGAIIAVSNSTAPTIRDLYKNCQIETVSARRAINSKGTARGVIDEFCIFLGTKPARGSLPQQLPFAEHELST